MPIRFAERLNTPISANWAVAQRVKELKAQGVAVIDAGQGSPTRLPNREVTIARLSAIAEQKTRYAATEGNEELREKITPYVNALLSGRQADLDPGFTAGQLAFTVGGTGGVFISGMLVGQPGASILFSKPGYSNYPGPMSSTGANIGHYETSPANGYVPTFEQLVHAVDPEDTGDTRVSAIIFNYPNNPTGRTLNREQAEALGYTISKLVKKYPHLLIINDIAYLGTARDGENFSFYPFLSDEAKSNTVNVFSSTKDSSLTNDRTGLIASANPEIINHVKKLLAFNTIGINSIGAAGFAEAGALYADYPNLQQEVVGHYQSRLKRVAEGLNDLAAKAIGADRKIVNEAPGGGMFVYADFSYLIGKGVPEKMREAVGHATIESSADIAKVLLSLHPYGYAPVATIPGEGFGDDPQNGLLRVACIESHELLQQMLVSFAGMLQAVTGKDLGAAPNYQVTDAILKKEANPDTVAEGAVLLEEAAKRWNIKCKGRA